MQKHFNPIPLVAALVLALPVVVAAQTQAPPASLQRLISAAPSPETGFTLAAVRKSILQEAARALGARAGLADRSKEIVAEINARANRLDDRYRFQQLIMDAALLPPVIVETLDAVSLEASVMRVAKATYRIDAPPRFVDVAPTWRDYLTLGLLGIEPLTEVDSDVAPRTEAERAFWATELSNAYAVGVRQAQQIFEVNLAVLNRTYDGMRTYYDLYARHMVSAPVLASSTEIFTKDDPNTISVGSTIFRVTVAPAFTEEPKEWVPLGK